MRRFQFQLEGLMRLKEQQQRQTELRLVAARTKATELSRQISQLEIRLVRVADNLHRQVGTALPADGYLAQQRYAETIEADMLAARQRLAQAEQACAAAAADHQQRKMELEALATLRAAARREYSKKLRAAEQEWMDAFAVGKWETTKRVSMEVNPDG